MLTWNELSRKPVIPAAPGFPGGTDLTQQPKPAGSRIGMIDLAAQYAPIRAEVDRAVASVFDSGRFILGPEVEALEHEIAALHHVAHAVGVASGTDALVVVWRALDLQPGDEVICPAMTFQASGSSIALAGGTPVFVDIDPETLNVDPVAVENAITPRTRAILAVHLYGQMADVVRLKVIANRHDLPLVEDCAQAIGAALDGHPAGSLGLAGTTSFYPSKNLGAPGEGGMIWTNDEAFAARLRRIRSHGEGRRYEHVELGTNSRLMALVGAVLRVKLRRLPEWTAARRANAACYDAAFRDLAPVVRPVVTDPRAHHVYHQYSILVEGRDTLRGHLDALDIENIVYYPIPLHLQPVFAPLGGAFGDLPHTERAVASVLSIPVHENLAAEQRQRVIDAVRGWALRSPSLTRLEAAAKEPA